MHYRFVMFYVEFDAFLWPGRTLWRTITGGGGMVKVPPIRRGCLGRKPHPSQRYRQHHYPQPPGPPLSIVWRGRQSNAVLGFAGVQWHFSTIPSRKGLRFAALKLPYFAKSRLAVNHALGSRYLDINNLHSISTNFRACIIYQWYKNKKIWQ